MNREILEKFKTEWKLLSTKQLTIPTPCQYHSDPHYIWDGSSYDNHISVTDSRDADFILFASKWILQLATALHETDVQLTELQKRNEELSKGVEHYRSSSDAYHREFVKYKKIADEILVASSNDMFALENAQRKIRELT
jgi:hypothetical protein